MYVSLGGCRIYDRATVLRKLTMYRASIATGTRRIRVVPNHLVLLKHSVGRWTAHSPEEHKNPASLM